MKNGNKASRLELKIVPPERVKVSEKQLSMIIAEKSRTKKEGDSFSWEKMDKVLNAIGPSTKGAATWKSVSLHLY